MLKFLEIYFDLLKGLAWPSVVVLIVLLFKDNISTLLSTLFTKTKEINMPGFSAVFDQNIQDDLEKLQEDVESVIESIPEGAPIPAHLSRVLAAYLQTVDGNLNIYNLVQASFSNPYVTLEKSKTEAIHKFSNIISEYSTYLEKPEIAKLKDRVQAMFDKEVGAANTLLGTEEMRQELSESEEARIDLIILTILMLNFIVSLTNLTLSLGVYRLEELPEL